MNIETLNPGITDPDYVAGWQFAEKQLRTPTEDVIPAKLQDGFFDRMSIHTHEHSFCGEFA